MRIYLKEWSPIDLGFRNASTDVPATASTSGKGSLTSLFGVAKRFLQDFSAPTAPSDPLSFHLIRQRLSGEKRLQVGDHAILHPDVGFQRMAAHMRSQHHV